MNTYATDGCRRFLDLLPLVADFREKGANADARPDAEKERYAEEHREGWVEFLDRLAVLVAKRRL